MEALPTRWSLDDADFCSVSFYEACISSQLHWHTHYLLTLYTDGNGILTVNGMELEVSPGDLVVLSSVDFHKHTIREGDKLSFYSIKFHYDQCSAYLRERLHTGYFPICAHLDGRPRKTAEDLVHGVYVEYENTWSEPESRLSAHLALELLLVMAWRNRVTDAQGIPLSPIALSGQTEELYRVNQQIYRAVGYIQEHFRDPSLNVADIAMHVGYTSRYFSQLFKTFFDCSCKEYIQKCRLEFAKRLLMSEELSIMRICQEAGYQNLSYFISVFRKSCGCTPGQFQERYKRRV